MQVSHFFSLLFLSMLFACGSPYFQEEKDIKGDIWTYDDPFSFSFHADDTVKQYDFVLDIHHRPSYPYQNIYFMVETVFPSGDTISDPFSVNLANKYGAWNGRCWGDDCKMSVVIQSNVRFKSIGEHQLNFSQYTRQDSLKGIQGFEFSILANEAQ